MKAVIIMTLLTLVSCSMSGLVLGPGVRPKYAPRDYQHKGIVKYEKGDIDFLTRSRREDAFKVMHDSCSGPDYKVTFEGTQQEGVKINPAFKDLSDSQRLVYIEFICTRTTASN